MPFGAGPAWRPPLGLAAKKILNIRGGKQSKIAEAAWPAKGAGRTSNNLRNQFTNEPKLAISTIRFDQKRST
jgi:hypothetical protein